MIVVFKMSVQYIILFPFLSLASYGDNGDSAKMVLGILILRFLTGYQHLKS